jgi:signal transduction histidine kinase
MSDPTAAIGEAPREMRFRPSRWRLPLLALVAAGLLILGHLDQVLRREYQSGASAQAAESDALLESSVRQRAATLHTLGVVVSGEPRPGMEAAARRFAAAAPAVRAVIPDVGRLYYLDSAGSVHDAYPRRKAALADSAEESPVDPGQLSEVRASHANAVVSTHRPGGGEGAMVVLEPVVRGARVVGFVAGVFPYRAMLVTAMGPSLSGPFAYRIVDDVGSVVAAEGDFPGRPARVVRRDVSVPGGRRWQLLVGVPPLQPLVPRLLTWLVGLLLIALVVVLVLREERRAERLALYSLDLEMLSRDLLDANVRLEDRAQQVVEAHRAKSRFLANASHELRTPINAIVGYNGLALEGVYGQLPAPLRQAHERIKAAADHLLHVVDDVLDLSKIELGRMTVEAQPLDVPALLASVADVVEPVAQMKGVRVDVTVARDLPRVKSDARHVRHALLNLASNAIKFTERGAIFLAAERDARAPDSRVAFIVGDTGVGIAPQDLARIFEEFEQVRPGGRGDSLERGVGLGLAVARRLAQLLGGEIEVTSRVGEGSRFVLSIPLVPPPLPAPAEAEGAASAPPPASEPASVGGADVERAVARTVEPAPTGSVESAPSPLPAEPERRAPAATLAPASEEHGPPR